MSSQASTARSTSSKAKDKQEPVIQEKPNVIESAQGRDSMRESINTLEGAVGGLIKRMEDLENNQSKVAIDMVAMQTELTNTIQDQFAAARASLATETASLITSEFEILRAERKTQVDDLRTELWDRVSKYVPNEPMEDPPLEGNLLQRSWGRAKRELRPGRPDRKQVKAIVIANAAEYLALVGAAQMAPVATANALTSALFI